MKTVVSGAVTALALSLLAAPVMAAPIMAGSNLSISGVNNVSGTTISFPQNGNLGVTSGSFTALGTSNPGFGGLVCLSCVSLNTITYSPTVSAGQIFSISNNGATASFSLDPGATSEIRPGNPGTIEIVGAGIATLSGFDPTRGNFAFSTQNGVLNNVTFSATVTAVPEPASLALFGSALLGLGMIRRRKNVAA